MKKYGVILGIVLLVVLIFLSWFFFIMPNDDDVDTAKKAFTDDPEELFGQNVNVFTVEINDLAHDVRQGIFPEVNGLLCEEMPVDTIKFSWDSSNLASNQCVLLGKAFSPAFLLRNDNDNIQYYYTHTLVGLSKYRQGDLEEIRVYNDSNLTPELMTTEMVPVQGLKIVKFYFDDDLDSDNNPATGDVVYLDGFAVVSAHAEEGDDDILQFKSDAGNNVTLKAIYDTGDKLSAGVDKSSFETQTTAHNPDNAETRYYHDISQPITICLESTTGTDLGAVVQISERNGQLEVSSSRNSADFNKSCNF